MKAHIGVDSDFGLVHTVRGTSGNVHDVLEGNSLLHGQVEDAFGDAGFQGVDKRPDANADVTWHIAMRPGKRKALDKNDPLDARTYKTEKAKSGIRAKVAHPFRVIKRQFGYEKTRYRGLKKDTAQLVTLSALSNLWMVRGQIDGGPGMSAPASSARVQRRGSEGSRRQGNCQNASIRSRSHQMKTGAFLPLAEASQSDHP